MRKFFTFLLALAASVGMSWASVTWISDQYGNYEEKGYYAGTPFTKDGVTVTMSDDAFFIVSYWGDASLQCVKGTFGPTAGNYVFSNSLGENFVKIIIAAGYTSDWEWFPKGDGWVLSGDEDNGYILTWTGNASTVTLMDNELHSVNQSIEGDIVFMFESDIPAWVRDGDTWDEDTKTLTVNSNTGDNAYARQTEIKHVIVSDEVTELGWGTFFFDSLMTTVELGNNLEIIGISAFNECRSLSTITVPASVTNIKVRAFQDCRSLTTFICEAVTPPTIGNAIFQNANNLTAIYVPAASVEAYKTAWYDYASLIKAIGGDPEPANSCGDGLTWELNNGELVISYDGEGTGVMNDFEQDSSPWKDQIASITSVVINEGAKNIGKHAFYECEHITTVTLANSVETIGEGAFRNCEDLASLELGNNIKTIEQEAFITCSALKTVTIGTGITSIGTGAFYGCEELTTVTCSATTPPILGMAVFASCPKLEHIYVPAESVDDYKTDWSNYESIIEAIGGGSAPTVTWNSSNVSDLQVNGNSYSKEGITLSPNASNNYAYWLDYGNESQNGIYFYVNATGGHTFSNSLGKNFTKIEMTLNGSTGWNVAYLGSGWNIDGMKVIWTGNASTVDLLTETSSFGGAAGVKSIVFYFEGSGGATAIDEISQGQTCKSQKLIKDGQLFILRDGKTYTVTGQQVR